VLGDSTEQRSLVWFEIKAGEDALSRAKIIPSWEANQVGTRGVSSGGEG